MIEEIDSGEEGESASTLLPLPKQTPPLQPWPIRPPYLSGYWSPIGDYLHPGTPPRLRTPTPRVCTAPPSPMHHRRVVEVPRGPPVELAKQESLDELRSTVKQAASSMERSTNDVKLLGQKMADATERMSESVLENTHALTLLAEVVDRLQVLIAASRAADCPITKTRCDSPQVNAQAAEHAHSPGHPEGQPGRSQPRPAVLQQHDCEASSSSPSSCSSSLTGSVDGPTTSQTAGQPASRQGSLKAELNTSSPPTSPQKRPQLPNGLSETLNPEQTCSPSNQRRKRKKKRKK